MVRTKITYYKMLTPERRLEIEEQIRAREAERVARRAARIAAGLPPDSPEPEEEEEQPREEEEEEQPMEVEEAEEPGQQVPAFTMEQAETEYVVAQSDEMAEQQAILESIQDEASMEANRAFLRRKQAESDALFVELDAEIEAEQPKASEEPELQLPPMLPPPGMEILVIFDEE